MRNSEDFLLKKRLARTVSEETSGSLAGALLSSLIDTNIVFIPQVARTDSFYYILVFASFPFIPRLPQSVTNWS